ncbi:MAG: stage III sporulation protein AB [Oscillospiraceae bacterium]|nr:stage III sporulation protein AB [Oscillospiraceae bacterium]
MIRWLGFVLIVCGASTCGVLLGFGVKREQLICSSLLTVLNRMKWELQFRLTPLPELFRFAAESAQEPVSGLFMRISDQISKSPGVPLEPNGLHTLPREIADVLSDLFRDLGRQDIKSQTAVLELAISRIRLISQDLTQTGRERSRVYRTLGVCAGISLAVILI